MTPKTSRKRQHPKLAQARAYYRLAAKASRAGEHGLWEHYHKVADRLVDQVRAEREARERRTAAEKAWRAKVEAQRAAHTQE
jgi:hypothetical protein